MYNTFYYSLNLSIVYNNLSKTTFFSLEKKKKILDYFNFQKMFELKKIFFTDLVKLNCLLLKTKTE